MVLRISLLAVSNEVHQYDDRMISSLCRAHLKHWHAANKVPSPYGSKMIEVP